MTAIGALATAQLGDTEKPTQSVPSFPDNLLNAGVFSDVDGPVPKQMPVSHRIAPLHDPESSQRPQRTSSLPAPNFVPPKVLVPAAYTPETSGSSGRNAEDHNDQKEYSEEP